jgi:hypothetical protein
LAVPPAFARLSWEAALVGALWFVFRAEVRRRWRSWLALAVLVALVGGVALAAIAAGRRTADAFPQFVATHGFDSVVYANNPVPQLAKLPQVASIATAFGPDNGQPTCRCSHPINSTDFGVLVAPSRGRSLFKLVSGHLPDPSSLDQVLASYTLQRDYGVHLGSVIRVPLYAASQATAYTNAVGALPPAEGPTIPFEVTGFEAAEFEFPAGGTPSYSLYATPAFARTVLPRVAHGFVYLVRLRHGTADVPKFTAETNALGAYPENLSTVVASIEGSIHPQALGWWILGALATLVGLAVVGQALFRQSAAEQNDYRTVAALGADRPQLIALATGRNLVVAFVGATGAMAFATALSPIFPLGEARVAEPTTGVSFDALVLLLGALVIVAIVLALGLWPAFRVAHTLRSENRSFESHPSLVADVFARMGAPPSMLIGVRHALERRSAGASVPVGSALLGTILAVLALCGTAVFGASLSHLTSTPRLYGEPFQVSFSNNSSGGKGGPDPALLASLERDRAVTGITEGFATAVSVGKVPVGAIVGTSLKGGILLSAVSGHIPSADDEVGLGVTTMHRAGVHVGSTVDLTIPRPTGGERTVRFRVVSQVSFPEITAVTSLGNGAVLTLGGFAKAACPSASGQAACEQSLFANAIAGGLLTSFVSGPRGQAAIDHYFAAYQSLATLPVTPTSLVNFGEAVDFPLVFGLMLAVFGAATLIHLLVVSVSRRRREVGLLKALGFVKGQVAAAVAWQATTLALIGIVVGVPLGIVVGRTVWNAFANNVGVVPVSLVQLWLIVTIAVGVVVVANVLAVAPGLVARRSNPQQLLRTQ